METDAWTFVRKCWYRILYLELEIHMFWSSLQFRVLNCSVHLLTTRQIPVRPLTFRTAKPHITFSDRYSAIMMIFYIAIFSGLRIFINKVSTGVFWKQMEPSCQGERNLFFAFVGLALDYQRFLTAFCHFPAEGRVLEAAIVSVSFQQAVTKRRILLW